MTTTRLFTVSGLRVQALVSGLLYSKIQYQRLLTDLGLFRASRTLAAVYKRYHVLLDPAYTATNGSTVISIHVS
jgi:hypothetical protein